MTADIELLTAQIDAVAAAAARLEVAASDAREEQWTSSRFNGPTTPGRVDPTGDTAVDPRRLRLREAVEDADAAVADATERLGRAATRLREAYAAWAGDPDYV